MRILRKILDTEAILFVLLKENVDIILDYLSGAIIRIYHELFNNLHELIYNGEA